MTDLEIVYRLAVILAGHLERDEDRTSRDLLPSDSVRGLIKEIELEASLRQLDDH